MRTLTSYVRQFPLAGLVILFSALAAVAQTTTFTHQGKLPDDYNQPTGVYDLQFNLYDEVTGMHTPLNATPIVLEEVQVTNGMFTVALDFGSLFDGGDRYLEIGVRPASDTGAFAVVSPRQRITSSPYAIRSLSAATADTATNAESLGGTAPGDFVLTTDARLTDARPPTAGSSNYIRNNSGVQSGANFNIGGTGTANVFNATTQFNIGGDRILSVAGTNNILVGSGAGAANTTGDANSVLGHRAGFRNTSGRYNVFLGFEAAYSNTGGGANSFVGYQAGYSNTTGSYNSFVGHQAGINNGTGSFNSFFGTAAGAGHTTGNNNSFVGYRAGERTTSGSTNAFFGFAAGSNNTTGDHNTLVGMGADVSSGNLSHATAIGANATVSASNTIVLGRSARQDTVLIPGDLNVTGTISGDISGVNFTNLNASNITTGTLNTARLGIVPVNKGGTGLATAGAAGSFLRSNGTGWVSSALQVGDLPDLGGSYIRNHAGAAQAGGFNITGNGTANVFSATTQFNIGGDRVLAVSGSSNFFAGVNTGTVNTTGIGNSFFGRNAGAANTEGIGNSFFGYQTGTRTTTGSDNSFFGIIAGNLNTTGASNSFFGTGAGEHNATGNNNSFFGQSAGDNNATGNNNSFFGYEAGASSTTGNFNSLVGSNAQVGTGGLSYATAVGARAVVNSSDTIVLGKSAGTYDGVSRPADTVQVPGNLSVTGTISGNVSGLSLTNLDANNITSGTLSDARLSANVATLSGTQTFTGAKTFTGGVSGDGSGLTGLNASNINAGTLDSARLGVVGVGNGGTGLTAAGANGNFLRSDGTGFTSSALAATDIPTGSASYIQNTTTQQANADFNISGDGMAANLMAGNTLSGNIVNATTQFNLGGNRVLSTAGSANLFAGIGTGYNNSTGGGNSFFGAGAGAGNTTGSNNTLIGSSTNVGSGNPSYATAIGAGATVNTSNTIVLGRSSGQDTIQIPGNLNVTGTISGNISSGTGTQGRLARWTDNAGKLADSTIFEDASGNIGVGTDTPTSVFDLRRGSSADILQRFWNTGAGGAKLRYVAGAGATSQIQFTDNAEWLSAIAGNNQIGLQFRVRPTSAVNEEAGLDASTRMTIARDGNVGIGTNSPTSRLDVAGAINASTQYNIGGNRVLGITPNGIFVGVAAGAANTTGGNNSFFGISAGSGNTTGGNNTIIGANANVGTNSLSYATAIGSEAMVSTSNTIALGRANGSDKVRIFGLGAAGSTQLCRNANNEVSTCSSSLRYKMNIAPFSFGLGLLRRLRPIRFEWKDGGIKDIGFGAEDVAAVEPLLVTYDNQGRVEGVKYDRFSAVLVNAVKEQQTQIETQQAQLNQQRTQIEAQQQQLRQQQALIDGLKKLLCQQNPTAEVCQ